jgi:uncharacterized protein with HEPN domain
VNYRDTRRLRDIAVAAAAIEQHLARGSVDDGLVFDAVCMRFVEIGEAVKGLSPDLTSMRPDVPWREIARMRDHLAHRYFATAQDVVLRTATDDLPVLQQAVAGLLRAVVPTTSDGADGPIDPTDSAPSAGV